MTCFDHCLIKVRDNDQTYIHTCIHVLETDGLIPHPEVSVALDGPHVTGVAVAAAAEGGDLGGIVKVFLFIV